MNILIEKHELISVTMLTGPIAATLRLDEGLTQVFYLKYLVSYFLDTVD